MDEASSGFQPKPQPIGRTQWHHILGALLELLLTRLGIIVQSEVQVMSDPPKVDIVLLRREAKQWTVEQLALLCDGLRDTLASHLLIEFKYSESLSAETLLQALGYDYFYRQTQGLAEGEIQSFVMVARTPQRKVLNHFGYVTSNLPGVYHSEQPLLTHIQLIVLNHLRPSPHNAFVQCFASQRRVWRNAFEQIQKYSEAELSERVWSLVAGLRTQRDAKGGIMAKDSQQVELTAEQLIQIGEETRRFVLSTISVKDRLAGLAPEERLAGLAPEERLAGLAPEEVEQLVEKVPPEKRLAGLTREEMQKLLTQIEAFLQQGAIDKESPPSA